MTDYKPAPPLGPEIAQRYHQLVARGFMVGEWPSHFKDGGDALVVLAPGELVIVAVPVVLPMTEDQFEPSMVALIDCFDLAMMPALPTRH